MRSQIFDIEVFKAAFRQAFQHMADMGELAARENILFDELTHAGAQFGVVHPACGNAVVHHQAARTDQAPELGKIAFQLGTPHMLEHAHRGNLVVGAGFVELTIIEQFHAYTARQSLLLNRSEERRVGKEWVSTCRTWGAPYD